MVNQKMRVLDPVGKPVVKTGGLAPRPADLQNKTLFVIDNCAESVGPAKLAPNYLLGFLMEEISHRHRFKEVRWIKKPSCSEPMPTNTMEEIVREADVVLNGTGF